MIFHVSPNIRHHLPVNLTEEYYFIPSRFECVSHSSQKQSQSWLVVYHFIPKTHKIFNFDSRFASMIVINHRRDFDSS